MRARRSTTKHTLNKGDLLDQKWLTYFLAIVLILLVLAFVVLLSPTYKRYVVDTVKTVFYGKKQKASTSEGFTRKIPTTCPARWPNILILTKLGGKNV